MKRIITVVFTILFVLPHLYGQDIVRKKYKAARITETVTIDGVLTEPVWGSDGWIDDFTQNEPYNGSKASQKTEFKLLYDEDNIYVAIKAFDTSPDSIVNRLTRRDQADGDLVGVIFDSFHDLRTGFLFGVSSAGVKYDMLFSGDGESEDPSWDPNWWVKTSINSEGWIAEMRIPLSQLRFEKSSSDVWGLQMARVLYRRNETSFWQHIPKDAPGFIHMIGELEGLKDIEPKKIFDITPYTVARAETFKAVSDNPFLSSGRKYRANGGIDAKIGVTNNMTMDLTINPDFGQVEADPSQVNLTAYETFFEEKRPFFIEGNNITNFGLGLGDGDNGNDNLFYSRRIGRQPKGSPDLEEGWNSDIPTYSTIIGAAKLTGKTKNGLSLGFVEAVTAEEYATIDTIGGTRLKESVEPLTNYFLGRVQKDFKEGNTIIGGIFTNTYRDLNPDLATFMHKSAYTGGIDFTQYFNEKNWEFNVNAAFSYVEGSKEAIAQTQRSSARYYQRPDNNHTVYDPDRTSLAGSGGRMQLTKQNGHLNLLACVVWKTPGFETNDLGYIRDADNVLSVLWAGYSQWEPKGIYRRYNINGDIFFTNNFGGDITMKGVEWNASITLKNYWSLWTGGNLVSTNLSTGMLRGGPMMKVPGNINYRGGFSTDSRKKFIFEVSSNGSNGFSDYSKYFNTRIELTYKPTNFLFLTFNPSYNTSGSLLQYVSKKSYSGADRYIFASIDRKTISASFRVNLNLTPDLTLQYWGQPFVATGKYYDQKYITNPMADKFGDRFTTFTDDQTTITNGTFDIDEDRNGSVDYSFSNKDFNIKEFLSNLVVRWEYNPGSTLYLVWNQTRSFENNNGDLNFFNDLGDLFNKDNEIPHNVFLVKFSYRFGLK